MAIGSDDIQQPLDADVVETLPWWRSWVNLVVLAVAIAALSGGVGYLIGNNTAIDDPNDTDVGFLQDMRYHHEQAIQMSLIYLDTAGTNPELRTIAREILVGQGQEVGRMIQLLRDFGKSEVNETDTAMGWMGHAMALDAMPGLATEDQLIELRSASGADADAIFVRLMSAHHEGGIEMAKDAAEHAGTAEVRKMAGQFVTGQQEEIQEMAQLLAAARAG